MFLKKIYLQNFKCFEEIELEFPNRFTVLIGDNGSGKTSLLEGIVAGFEPLIRNLIPSNHALETTYDFEYNKEQVRIISNKIGSKSSLEKQYPCKVEVKASLLDSDFTWWHSDAGGNFSNLTHLTKSIKSNIQKGSNEILPIIGFYSTSRHWSNKKEKEINLAQVGSRLEPYLDCTFPTTNSKVLIEWFKRMALISFQRMDTPPELAAVKKALETALKKLSPTQEEVNVYFSAEDDELIVNIGDGQELPFRMLSDGYRNTLGLIGDIAYRMAELNPHITTATPGVILIDEIDLHLHPKWQRSIIDDLKTIFPKCQFIVTTHSPFIIQALSNDDSLIEMNIKQERSGDFINQSIEDIAEHTQGVTNPQWSEKRKELYETAKHYYATLEEMNGNMVEEELIELRNKLEKLKKPFTNNPAYSALMEQERIVREAEITKNKK